MQRKSPLSPQALFAGFAVFLLVAAIWSQWRFRITSQALVGEIRELSGEIALLAHAPDTARLSSEAVKLQQATLAFQQEQFELELERQKQQLFWYNIGFFGLSGILGFITLLFWLPKQIESQAKHEVDQQLRDILRGRSEVVRRLLEENDRESTLLKEKRICITGAAGNTEIRDMLLEYGIPAEHLEVAAYPGVGVQHFDVLLVNNKKGDILTNSPPKEEKETEEGQKKEAKHEETWTALYALIGKAPAASVVFYYCENGVNLPMGRIPDFSLKKRINFATNPAQVFGNLLSSLKYQDRISRG
ncbi:MAG: hypothetical protein IPN20_03020 [Haliscomenobacter sp.]|nr:hypothetical protein [Haliscomenobacter sp.]